MTDEAITFPAEIIKVQTMQDGAIRVTLDLSADMVAIAAKLMEAKQRGCILEMAAVAVQQSLTNGKNETDERTKRNPLDVVGG